MTNFVCASVLVFDDNTCHGMVLHSGTKESCDEIADVVACISYGGDKTVIKSELIIMPDKEWNDLWRNYERE